jgi:hypothetical protein
MKPCWTIAALLAVFCLTHLARAAEATPAGVWKWTPAAGRGDNGTVERVLVLEYKDGQLTGMLKGIEAPRFSIPDVVIAEGVFKEGRVAFTVTNEFNGARIVVKYAGALKGDEIVGDTSRLARDGREVKSEWHARRVR